MNNIYYTTIKNEMYKPNLPICYAYGVNGHSYYRIISGEEEVYINSEKLKSWVDNDFAAGINSRIKITIDLIIGIVYDIENAKIELINTKSRKPEIVRPRQLVHYFCKKHTDCSYPTIGRKVGGKDHATVMHSIKVINNLYETEADFRKKVDEINDIFESINK